MDKKYDSQTPDIIMQASKEFSPRNLPRWLVTILTPLENPTHYHLYYGAENHANSSYLSFMMTAIEADLNSHGFKHFRPIETPVRITKKE